MRPGCSIRSRCLKMSRTASLLSGSWWTEFHPAVKLKERDIAPRERAHPSNTGPANAPAKLSLGPRQWTAMLPALNYIIVLRRLIPATSMPGSMRARTRSSSTHAISTAAIGIAALRAVRAPDLGIWMRPPAKRRYVICVSPRDDKYLRARCAPRMSARLSRRHRVWHCRALRGKAPVFRHNRAAVQTSAPATRQQMNLSISFCLAGSENLLPPH